MVWAEKLGGRRGFGPEWTEGVQEGTHRGCSGSCSSLVTPPGSRSPACVEGRKEVGAELSIFMREIFSKHQGG